MMLTTGIGFRLNLRSLSTQTVSQLTNFEALQDLQLKALEMLLH